MNQSANQSVNQTPMSQDTQDTHGNFPLSAEAPATHLEDSGSTDEDSGVWARGRPLPAFFADGPLTESRCI